MTEKINPYIAGVPVQNTYDFFGRQETAKWVESELAKTNTLVLFGQRRIGKTSFLWKLQQALPADAFLPVYFNLHDQDIRVVGQLLADLADDATLVANLKPLDPLAFDDQGRFFRRTFLPQFIKQLGSERRVVFLLDEFDMLEQIAPPSVVKALLSFLRRLMNDNARLAFVFIMGKGVEELSLDFTALFKSASVSELWVLDQTSAEQLIHQATTNGTLQFTDQAIARILSLTNCHPYLMQLLCKELWKRAYSSKPTMLPLIAISDVEASVPATLKSGKHALIWWWQGLRRAEKIYIAVLAQIARVEKLAIPEEQMIRGLAAVAVPLYKRSVKLAQERLVTRRVLEVTEEGEYRFTIELFRRWVQQNRSLQQVKDEINQGTPDDSGFFNIGLDYFRHDLWESANLYFQHALAANPRHFHARLYLGQALLELGQIDKAITELEQAYELNPAQAKPAYLRGLLSQVEASDKTSDEEGVLSACGRILQVSPNDWKALARQAAIWNRRGDVALAKDDLSAALRAYQEAGNQVKMAEVLARQRTQTLQALERKAQSHAQAGRWAEAHAIYQQLIRQAQDQESRAVWQTAQAHCTQELELASLFDEGIRAMQQEKWELAVAAFLQVVNRRYGYQKDGSRATQLLDQVAKETPPIPFPAPFFPLVPPTDSSAIRREPVVRSYRNFDLRLAIKERNQLLVEVLNAPAGEAMGRAFISEGIDWEMIEDELGSLSQELGSLLMPGEVRHCFEASRGMVSSRQSGLRLRLRINDSALSMLPWEAARIGEEYLSLQPHTPLVRYVQASSPPTPLAVNGPLQVVGLISNARDLRQLNVSLERSHLEEALQPLIKEGRVNLTWLSSETQLLQDALRQNPAVIHFIGHGQYDDDSQKGLLWFTDTDGKSLPLSADWLATLLRGTSVRFVFLNACESGRAAGGLAEVLVRRGIPAVLGMQTSVSDDVAIAFAAGFYNALRDGWPVDAALVEGRKAIVNALGNSPDKADWTYPVLYMRAPDGQLFE